MKCPLWGHLEPYQSTTAARAVQDGGGGIGQIPLHLEYPTIVGSSIGSDMAITREERDNLLKLVSQPAPTPMRAFRARDHVSGKWVSDVLLAVDGPTAYDQMRQAGIKVAGDNIFIEEVGHGMVHQ